MMPDYIAILFILFAHWVADFVCQSHYQGVNKSKDNWVLTSHIIVYTSVMCLFVVFMALICNIQSILPNIGWFTLITFICHFCTDYFTSRWTSRLYKAEKYHDFFVIIGFDQFLHSLQLILTYIYLINL